MRYYNAEGQLFEMLFAHLTEYAARSGKSPAELLSDVMAELPQGGQREVMPAQLFDTRRTPEERYAWLCAQMDKFRVQEAARRADIRMTSEAAKMPALLKLIDGEGLSQTMRLLREDADTYLLALASDDAFAWGLRLSGVHGTHGPITAPMLRTTAETDVSPEGGVTLVAMTVQGEVSLTFTGAVEVTVLYNYTASADANTVLLPAYMRLVWRLHKLAEKVLQPEPLALSDGECDLVPVAIGASFLLGGTESVEMVQQYGADSAFAPLREMGNHIQVAATGLFGFAISTNDRTAAACLAPMLEPFPKRRAMRRGLVAFASHIKSARGEAFCRAITAALEAATADYPAPPLLAEAGDDVATASAVADRVLRAQGFVGTWPHYRQEHALDRARLFAPNALLHTRILPRGKRLLSMVDCVPFLQDGMLCVNFSCATIPLKKGEDAAVYADSDSAAFDVAHRRLQRFAAGLILDEEQRTGAYQLTLEETAKAAAATAKLVPLTERARTCVVHANAMPVWQILVGGGIGTLLGGGAARLLLGLATKVLSLSAGVSAVVHGIGILLGAGYGVYRTILALIGRRKL